MGIPASQQLCAFLYSILCGVILGILHDVLAVPRALCGFSEPTAWGDALYRRRLPGVGYLERPQQKKFYRLMRMAALTVDDILFAAVSGCVFSLFLYHRAAGIFRWFYLLGAGAGIGLYLGTLGRFTAVFTDVAAYILRAAVRYMVLPLCLGGRLICFIGRLLRSAVWAPCAAAVQHRRRIRYTARVQRMLPQLMSFSEEGVERYELEE